MASSQSEAPQSTELSEVPKPIGTSSAANKVKHDWYQTESAVIISIMVKNMKSDDVRVMYGQKTLSVTLHFPDGSDLVLGFNLSHQIVPAQSSHRILSTKVEIKLKKMEDIRWEKLECEKQNAEPSNAEGTSKARESKNWDKVVVELTNAEEDKPQGEAALNALFQQIYGDGSDEVRRAMNKSFVESGGTVLSTVWKDVGKEKVDVKAPDGMEWRKWDQ